MSARVLTVLVLSLVPGTMLAQQSPYAAHAGSSIKALAPDELAGYLDGAGMGFALAAELNGYPGPRHVLELADSLGLDADRRAAVQAIFDAMNSEARQLGAAVVAAEATLDSAFAEGRITDADLEDQVLRAGILRGRLRLAHLRAHLAVVALLTPAERQAYARLRGYGDRAAGSHHH
jgi:hypothetical protein